MQQEKSISLVTEFVKGLTFEEVKTKAVQLPYNFKVSDFQNLYMVSFTQDSNMTLEVARAMNGVIFEKNTNRLVHYSFQKAYDGVYSEYNDNEKDCYRGSKPEEYKIEISVEGTHIKVYWYDNEWRIGTSRSIEASLSHWGGSKSFKELFFECLDFEKIDINSLDKTKCYSFIIQHPENKVCYNIDTPYCAILNSVDIKNETVSEPSEGLRVENMTLDEVLESLHDEKSNRNYTLYLHDGVRIKLLNEGYKKIQKLIKNDPNLERVYLRCMKEGTEKEIRDYFPNSRDVFDNVVIRFVEAVNNIHETYMNVNVRRSQEAEIYHKYEKSIKQLHWWYRKTRERVTKNKVEDLLLNLNVNVLLWVIDLK